MSPEELSNFLESQKEEWEIFRKNHDSLTSVERKPFRLKGIDGCVQFNPARAISTLANVDSKAIEKRDCFLCKKNRSLQQKAIEILPGWDLLVNPFPILPLHFTIASQKHEPQIFSKKIGEDLAKKMDGMVIFYNAPGAGASAPDHCHYQAVAKENLPLIESLDNNWGDEKFLKEIPFKILKNFDDKTVNSLPMNVFFWKGKDGSIRSLAIPRKAHRPKQYFLDVPERRLVSPGAIDLCGIIVTPSKEDFEAISHDDIEDIISQVTFKNE